MHIMLMAIDDDILLRKMNHFQYMGTAMKKSILIYVFAQNWFW